MLPVMTPGRSHRTPVPQTMNLGALPIPHRTSLNAEVPYWVRPRSRSVPVPRFGYGEPVTPEYPSLIRAPIALRACPGPRLRTPGPRGGLSLVEAPGVVLWGKRPVNLVG